MSREESSVLSYIGFTHAGIYCKICLRALAVRQWRTHFRNEHAAIALPCATRGFVESLEMRVVEVKRTESPHDFTDDPKKTFNRLFCMGCSKTFVHLQNLQRHWLLGEKNCSQNNGYKKLKCYKLHCGRYYPISVPEYVIYPGPKKKDVEAVRRPLSLLSLNSASVSHPMNTGQDPMQYIARCAQNTNQNQGPLSKSYASGFCELSTFSILDTTNSGQHNEVAAGGKRPQALSSSEGNNSSRQAMNPGSAYMQYFTSLPQNNLYPTTEIDAKLSTIIDKGDDTKYWRKIFHKAVATDPSFIEHHQALLESNALKPHIVLKANDELQKLHDLFCVLDSHTKGIVDGVPANLKAKLVKFSIPRDGECELEGATTWTFRYREKSSDHVNEFRYLLCFLHHMKCPQLQKYLDIVSNPLYSSEEAQSSGVIAKLLYELVIEGSPDSDYIPIICRFAQFRCMMLRGETLRLKSANVCGKVFASVLYILRFGVLTCTSMMLHGGNESQASEMLGIVQGGQVINTISPWIAYCKAMSARSANIENCFIEENGDIVCNNVTFQKRVYCQLIPLVCRSIRRLFTKIFVTDDWCLFLPESGSRIQIGLDWRYSGDVQAHHGGRTVKIDSLKICGGYHIEHPLHQELVSEIEIIFHGLSGGCERYQTIRELLFNQVWITNNMRLFFKAVHNKNHSVRTTAKKPVTHQIPPSAVMLYILFRRVCAEVEDSSYAISSIPFSSRTHTLVTALCRHFSIDPKITTAVDIRHLYTSATNVLAENSKERLVADSAGAMSNNHTPAVHEAFYATIRIGEIAKRINRYHKFFGECQEGLGQTIGLMDSLISKAQQIRALQTLFGEQATFTGPDQELMINSSCNSLQRHKYFGIPCGHGKSLSLLIPLVVEKNLRRFSGCRIIVLPYGFLKDSLEEAFRTKLHQVNGTIEIKSYSAADICETGLPHDLTAEDPPEILLLTADAAANLVRCHKFFLKTLHDMNALSGIWFDEIQTLYSEFNFRKIYEILPQYAAVGAPITLLSGSFPITMVPSLTRYLKLLPPGKEPGESIDIVQGANMVGSGVQFDVIIVRDIVGDTLEIMSDYFENFGRSIHVLCASKATCKEFESQLQGDDDVRVVHADTRRQDQLATAADWYHQRCKKLFTTSIGIVGNENEAAGLICVVGILHDLSNLLQAIGRLRPKQRGPEARVYQILLDKDLRPSKTMSDECNFKRDELIQAGVLSIDDALSFDGIFHIDGYKAFLNGEGCYLRRLESMFSRPGSTPQSACGRCTWCRTRSRHLSYASPRIPCAARRVGHIQVSNEVESMKEKSPITLAREAALADESYMVDVRYVAMCKIAWLKEHCPVCISSACTGECMYNSCYICGESTHNARDCKFHFKSPHGQSLDKFLRNKNVCNWCIGKMGEENHGPTRVEGLFELLCPLKNRLRCAINHLRMKGGFDHHADYGDQIREICSSEECYYRFISLLNVNAGH